jgi:hypothetical protein
MTAQGPKAEYLPNARMSASTGSGHGCALARAALCRLLQKSLPVSVRGDSA